MHYLNSCIFPITLLEYNTVYTYFENNKTPFIASNLIGGICYFLIFCCGLHATKLFRKGIYVSVCV